MDGCITARVRTEIERIAASGLPVVVDSRDRAVLYRGVTLKPSEVEAVRAAATFVGCAPEAFTSRNFEGFTEAAELLRERLGCVLSVIMDPNGSLQVWDGRTVHVPARPVSGELDFCGAGDTFLSTYVCALATGATPTEAGQIGSIASEVTIRKIGQTGTATQEEIKARYDEAYRN